MVFYNHIVNGIKIAGPIAYTDVLQKTGLTDQVGLTELGWVEDMPEPEEPEITKAQIDAGTRNLRTYLLQQSDWTQLPDSPLTPTQKTAWATYRQQLRDMPATFASVTKTSDIVVPTAPT